MTWNRVANCYRLSTEAEWEYACRAGTTTIFNTDNWKMAAPDIVISYAEKNNP